MRFFRNIVRGWIDGVLTALGIVMGSSVAGSSLIVIIAGLAGGIGSSFASITSATTAEKAAIYKEIVDLEKKMMLDKKYLKGLRIFKIMLKEASKKGVMDGISTFSGAMIPIIPFVLFPDTNFALTISIATSFFILFVLGTIIGKISKENILAFGLKTLAFGLITFLVVEFVYWVFKI